MLASRGIKVPVSASIDDLKAAVCKQEADHIERVQTPELQPLLAVLRNPAKICFRVTALML